MLSVLRSLRLTHVSCLYGVSPECSNRSASPAALWLGCCSGHAFCFVTAACLHHHVALLDLGAIGAGQLHLLLTRGGLLATLTLVHHLVSLHRISVNTHRHTHTIDNSSYYRVFYYFLILSPCLNGGGFTQMGKTHSVVTDTL